MKPLKHQEKFVKGYNGKRLLSHEAGSGKSVCGALWLKDNRDNDALVVCPKQIIDKWNETLKLWGTKATVVSKENFKKLLPKKWSAIVIDEADQFASPLFTRARSQLTTCMYELLKRYPTETLLTTATPIRSNPWNLHTLLVFSGVYIDWKKWRDTFFTLEKRPYLPRPAWLPRKDWRQKIRPVLEKYSDIVLLKDCVGELPPITEEVVNVSVDPYEATEWEGTKAFFDEHRHEQKNKIGEILKLSSGFSKIVIVAYYVEQVESIAKELSKDRETFMIHGGTKNHEQVIKNAQESSECFIVLQASIGAGFDLDQFSCCIFASMSYAVRDFVQMKARLRRIHNLHPIVYYYLLAGDCDKAIYKNVQLGKSFIPSEWISHPYLKNIEEQRLK